MVFVNQFPAKAIQAFKVIEDYRKSRLASPASAPGSGKNGRRTD